MSSSSGRPRTCSVPATAAAVHRAPCRGTSGSLHSAPKPPSSRVTPAWLARHLAWAKACCTPDANAGAVVTWSASHFGHALVFPVVSANFEEGAVAEVRAVAVGRCCVQAGDLEKSARRELELLRAACDGDEHALGELCQLCWRPVYRSLARYTSDPAEAEDMTQEVFLRALRSLPRFEDRGLPFTVYLLRIAANLARDRWRALPSRPVVTADVPEGSAPAQAAEEVAVENERRRALIGALDRLSPDQRAVLRMRILEGRSTREVAALTHRNEPAVRQLQVRALAALRLELSSGDEG